MKLDIATKDNYYGTTNSCNKILQLLYDIYEVWVDELHTFALLPHVCWKSAHIIITWVFIAARQFEVKE